jgi:uncharacterized membrane protein
MRVRVHEIHAASVHFPLALLPVTAAVDLASVVSGSMALAWLGKTLWWVTAGSVVLAGIAGLAASQEVKAEDRQAHDMMWVHGMGNAVILVSSIGVAAFRTFTLPSVSVSAIGLAVWGFSLYTASLGGKMVYGHGIGVQKMPKTADTGVLYSPPVLSVSAPAVFVRDAVKGVVWLFSRARDVITGRRPLARGAFGFGNSDDDAR